MPARDPRTAYTQPPFEKQDQSWPALVARMQPRPGLGETSYRGSGRLAGLKALITGGDSGIAAFHHNRPGQPAEIASLYVLLADPLSSFASGDIFGSTGGKPQG